MLQKKNPMIRKAATTTVPRTQTVIMAKALTKGTRKAEVAETLIMEIQATETKKAEVAETLTTEIQATKTKKAEVAETLTTEIRATKTKKMEVAEASQ